MPGKHVHVRFAESTPSPSFTSSTLPSSGGPPTPLSAYGSQYCPLPAIATQVNPVLARAATPALSWNLVSSPQEVRPTMPSSVSVDVLRQSATYPPLPSMRIVSSQLPWTLTITPQSGPFVTVGDFITGLYSSLRTSVTADEFSRIPTHSIQNAVRAAYINRCSLVQMRAEEEKAQGVKRIDFLCQQVRFMGLSSIGKDATFKLSVA